MEKEIYLANPCKASSLPFWKTNQIAIPENMMIMLEEELQNIDTREYSDERYFKLVHYMNDIARPDLDGRYELACCGFCEYASHIAVCYDDVGISSEELARYQKHQVYDKDLWIAVREREQNTIVASGIAEFDADIKEGILEWIQVSPRYRGKGLGKYIVKELLWRMKDKADFVTVSGKVDNKTKPELLYRNCGFVGDVVWHILRKNEI